MTDEVVVPAESSAPEQVVTESPVAEVVPPVEQPVEPPKTFTQEELDAAISKRLAREQRKWEREHKAPAAPPQPAETPTPDSFKTTEEYADALATQKAEQILRDREAQREHAEVVEAYHDREEEARTKYDDFEQVAYNPKLKITEVMAQAIQTSEIGPDVAYYLGTNPKEADRISRLPPLAQAREIGKLESKVSSNPPAKKTTSAPAPIEPVTPRSSSASNYDTTDPRSIKTMTTSEWIAAERARQVKKMQASH